jgi:hypothetical protein
MCSGRVVGPADVEIIRRAQRMVRPVRDLLPYIVSRGCTVWCNPLNLQAGLTRLELATSDVTGRVLRYPIISFFNEIHMLGSPPPRATPLRNPVFYPHSVIHSVIGQDSSISRW